MSGVRIGVVGGGALSQTTHLPLLSKMRGAELVAICDNDRGKGRALADRFGIPDVFTDIEDLLDTDQVDAVVISTPNHLHEPHVLSALAAKVSVLCERPLALTSKGVERILAAALRVDRKVLVGNNHRFRSDVQALDRFLRGAELGKLTGIRAGAYRQPARDESWRRRRAEAGGGAFLDQGLPQLDLALWLADFPDAVRVSAHMDRAVGARSVEDAMLVQLEFSNGVAMAIDVSTSYVGEEDRWWFETISTRGSTRLAPLRVVKELNGRPTDVSPTGAAARENVFLQSYRAQLRHFVDVVAAGTEYEPPSDQVKLMKLVEAVYRAAEEGKEIRL